MKKLLLMMLVVTGIQLSAQAQENDDDNKFAVSIGPELAFPAKSVFSIGYGASATIEIPVKGKFVATLSGGYSSFRYKTGIVTTAGQGQLNALFIPLKAGVRYTAGPGLYLAGELGNVIQTRGNTFTGSRNLFAFSLGPGFLIKLSEKQNIDLGFRFEQWSQGTLQQTAIRVAYRVGW